MVRCDHAPSKMCKVSDKNDRLNNWSQEIHSITPHIGFEYIKGKEKVFANS